MNADRLTLIRSKNTAFDALSRAEVECYKRRKRGPLPTSWLARLRQLEDEYAAALAAMGAKVVAW